MRPSAKGYVAFWNMRAILTLTHHQRPMQIGLDCCRGNDISAAKMDQAAAHAPSEHAAQAEEREKA
ncbi:MAG TPA: hypothetical protein VE420_16830, partial [Gemmatimonadales bacterium]|nr:hypothetical protein [Gemmatimonadales bacterium]